MPPAANFRPPTSAPRRNASEGGGGGAETGYTRHSNGAGGRGLGGQDDVGCVVLPFAGGEADDDFQDRPKRRASGGSSEQGDGSGEARSGGRDGGAGRAQRLPLGPRRNGAAEEAEVLAARAVWGSKKPRLNVYSAVRASACTRSPLESPTSPQRKPQAAGEPGVVTAPSISPPAANAEKPGEVAARVTAAAILKRASKKVLLAKGRRKKKRQKGKGEQQTGKGNQGGGERAKRSSRQRLVRAGDIAAGKATLPRSTARPTLLEQLGVKITTMQGPTGEK